MNAKIKQLVAAIALACVSTATISSGKTASAAGYDFNYRRGGEDKILPLQVFDNGRETYFQFSERVSVVPAILIETPAGDVVSKYHRSGAYIVIDGVADRYKLHFGTLAGSVQYGGQAREVTAGRAPEPEREVVVAAGNTAVATVATAVSATGGTTGVATAAAPAVAVTYPVSVPPPMTTAVALPASAPRQEAPLSASAAVGASPSHGTARVSEEMKTDSRVVFASGKTVLGAEGLAEVKRAVGNAAEVTKVSITGRDDQDFKDGVARARALQIRAAAMKFGVAHDKIVMREGFAREGDGATQTASDISVVRMVTVAAREANAILPASVADAIAMVARGLQALVKLRSIEEGLAGRMLQSVKALAGSSAAATTASAGVARVETAAPTVPDETWAMLPADGTAQRGMRKWAERAGITLEWQADVDYPIAAPIVVKGTFRTAINSVRETLAHVKRPLAIEVDGARVIVRNLRS